MASTVSSAAASARYLRQRARRQQGVRAARGGGNACSRLTPAEVAAGRATTLCRSAWMQEGSADTAEPLPCGQSRPPARPAPSLGQTGAAIHEADEHQRVGGRQGLGGRRSRSCSRHSGDAARALHCPPRAPAGLLSSWLRAGETRECACKARRPALWAAEDQVAWRGPGPEFRPWPPTENFGW